MGPVKKDTCILRRCSGQPYIRGLCVRHYHQARRAIERGKTAWPVLEQLGLSLPPGRANDIERAIAEAQPR
jgi:hypothetical protein